MFTKLSFKDGVLDLDVRKEIGNIFENSNGFNNISIIDNIITLDKSQHYTNYDGRGNARTYWQEDIEKIDINNFIDGYLLFSVYGFGRSLLVMSNNEFNKNYSLVGNYNDFCYHNESIEYLLDYRNITNEYDLFDSNKKAVIHSQWNI
jgi:hypothetical protein